MSSRDSTAARDARSPVTTPGRTAAAAAAAAAAHRRARAGQVLMLYAHPNYLYRMTTLSAIGGLAAVVGVDVTLQSMLPLVVRMAADPGARADAARRAPLSAARQCRTCASTLQRRCAS